MDLFPLLYETLCENYPQSSFSLEDLDGLHTAARYTRTPIDSVLVIATHAQKGRYLTVTDSRGAECRIIWAAGSSELVPGKMERTVSKADRIKFTYSAEDSFDGWVWWTDQFTDRHSYAPGSMIHEPTEAEPDRWLHEAPMETTGLALRAYASQLWKADLEYVTVRSLTDTQGKPTMNERMDRISHPALEALSDSSRDYMALGMGLEDAVFDRARDTPRHTVPFKAGEVAIAAYRDSGADAAATVLRHYKRGYDTPAKLTGAEGMPLDVFLREAQDTLAMGLSFGELLPIRNRLEELDGDQGHGHE